MRVVFTLIIVADVADSEQNDEEGCVVDRGMCFSRPSSGGF
jgi:hypothetical protein